MSTNWEKVWDDIEKAGNVERYIQQQLELKGFIVKRRATDTLSARELENYKKELKAEALAKRQLKKETWQAYRSTHIVHLGTGIYWSDDSSHDRWDLESAEKRLLENQLPALTQVKHLTAALNVSIPQLRGLCYQRDAATDTHYHRFEIAKRSGGVRAIWAPVSYTHLTLPTKRIV